MILNISYNKSFHDQYNLDKTILEHFPTFLYSIGEPDTGNIELNFDTDLSPTECDAVIDLVNTYTNIAETVIIENINHIITTPMILNSSPTWNVINSFIYSGSKNLRSIIFESSTNQANSSYYLRLYDAQNNNQLCLFDGSNTSNVITTLDINSNLLSTDINSIEIQYKINSGNLYLKSFGYY